MKTFLVLLAVMATSICEAQQLVTYPAVGANLNKASDKFSVSIIQNGRIQKSFTYQTTAGNGNSREWGREQNNSFHFTNFSFSGTVTVEVVKLNSSASSAIIRPTRLGIGTVRTISQGSDQKITFRLTKPTKVSVEFNDDPQLKDALMIFGNELERDADLPKNNGDIYYIDTASDINTIPTTATTVYFKPGLYKIGYWNIPARIDQVYLAGGAYVMGYLYRKKATIKINGRGVLSDDGYIYHYPSTAPVGENTETWYKMIQIDGGQNHMIEGITLINATSYNIKISANNVLIKNVKINGFRFNNDGININGSGNTIEGCMIRANDDAIATYGSNLTINNCVFWQLQGSVIQLGWSPHNMDSISVTNCDVLHDKATNSEGNVGFVNAMNYTTAKETAVIKDVTIKNIYFDTPILRFIDIRGDRSFKLKDYNATSIVMPWIYRNFSVSNIYLKGWNPTQPLIYLRGFKLNYPLQYFVFENVYINEKKVTSKYAFKNNLFETKDVTKLTLK